MADFFMVSERPGKNGVLEIYPRFKAQKSKDLMIRGGKFYAVWREDLGRWSTDIDDAERLVDMELQKYAETRYPKDSGFNIRILYLWDAQNQQINRFLELVNKQMTDNYVTLDEKLVFSNTPVSKKDYSSMHLNYPLEPGDYSAWDKLIGTLYSEEERHKIEWAIGSIVSGESKELQKFMVLYGAPGTGKGTILGIIEKMFTVDKKKKKGYTTAFDAKAIGNSSKDFALAPFKNHPLVGIQGDGDLSRIEDNANLNALVSHETILMNDKNEKAYPTNIHAFLFMGTNKPVKITDAKSGLLRRLIDVNPSGKKFENDEYTRLIAQTEFEYGAIAWHCKEVYLADKHYYDKYTPINMMRSSNDFYNFIADNYYIFKQDDSTNLSDAWELYKKFCEETKCIQQKRMVVGEELKNYFWDYQERFTDEGGNRIRSYYSGFRTDKFEPLKVVDKPKPPKTPDYIQFMDIPSVFDTVCADCPAQYAVFKNDRDQPGKPWVSVTTTLKELDTSRLHYVKVPINHIVVDFDIPDENGEKSLEKNLVEASKWPKTYAELSKSGKGIHLHYIYTGDPEKLDCKMPDNPKIEIKVFKGGAALRRMLTKNNGLPIADISCGLPLKGEKVINTNYAKSEARLTQAVVRCLNKETPNLPNATKPNMDFMYKLLEEAYADKSFHYDLSNMKNAAIAFAMHSTHNSDYCLRLIDKMHFQSDEPGESITEDDKPIVIFDIEVFPNLLIICWKFLGPENPVIQMINPTNDEIRYLITHYRLIGFNNRRYDNQILYAYAFKLLTVNQCYKLSNTIVSNDGGYSVEAANVSYTDIYDFASSAHKQSLKKFEIEMSKKAKNPKSKLKDSVRDICKNIHHKECRYKWDQDAPEEAWQEIADYCKNDVLATEAVFYYLESDWIARQILADLAEMTVNDTTNQLTTRIIFGKDRHPQEKFFYRDLSQPVHDMDEEAYAFLSEACPKMMSKTHGPEGSLLPYFQGYKFEGGVSTYKDINPSNPNPERRKIGEGGFVYSEPGIYTRIALLDIASMHPHSVIAEVLFGVAHTKAFREIVEGRVSIKHEAWETVNTMLNGKLTPYIQKVIDGEISSGDLANALKTAINSVYGLTSAKFPNAFRDERNLDNIVAKRGALFMIDLKEEVQKRGFTVAHIKTDSIKIPDATPEIIQFVMDFGEEYGYTFEHEATYDRMCLINKAVYIAKYSTAEECQDMYGYIPGDNAKHGGEWTATGDEFAVPYIFKTMFSHEEVTFDDLCETFSVSKGELYLDMNEKLPDVKEAEKELSKLEQQYKKGTLSDTTFESEGKRLSEEIAKGHNYIFVGRVGEFCPIREGCGGGVLYRGNEGKWYAASGTTGYRWLESEVVEELGLQDSIDYGYFEKLVEDAKADINIYGGDYERFVSDEPYPSPAFELGEFMNHPVYPEEIAIA